MKKRFGKGLKKNAYIVVLAVLGATMLMGGCGGKTEEQQRADYYQNELGLSKSEAQELAADVQKELNGTSGNGASAAGEEGVAAEYQIFPKAAAWSTLTLEDRAIQIDDVVYKAPITMAEFIKLLESSSITYEYEYNPDKLVGASREKYNMIGAAYYYFSSDDGEKFTVYRDGTPWLSAFYTNFTGETIALSDVFVGAIKPEEAAKDYCYYLDGRSMEDLRALKYNDVKDLGNSLFAGYKMSESKGSDTINISFYRENPYVIKNGCQVYEYYDMNYFSVDADTAVTKKVDLEYLMEYVFPKVYDAVTDYSQLSKEDIKTVTDAGIAAYEANNIRYNGMDNYFAGAQYTPVGISMFPGNYGNPTQYFEGIEIQYYDICTLYKVKLTDGNEAYVYATLGSVMRTDKGELIWDIYHVALGYNAFQLYRSKAELEEGEYVIFPNYVSLIED